MSRHQLRPNFKIASSTILQLSSVAGLVLMAFATASTAQSQSAKNRYAPVHLNMSRMLDEEAPGSGDNTSTFASAYRMRGSADERLDLFDDAEVRRGGIVMKGDRISYTNATDEVEVEGNARISRSGTSFNGPKLNYKLDAQTGIMPNAKFSYAPKRIRGTSDSLEFVGEKKAKLCNAIITTCQEGDDSWWIKADTVDIDENELSATGRNAALYIKGMPIFASPYFSFPFGEDRKSGFLTPNFGMSSTLGVHFSIPYYWNIAPNYDYTFTPHLMSKRGVLLGNEVRYLERNFSGQFVYDILPEDRVMKEKRYGLSWQHYYRHNSGITFGADYNRVSDDEYVSDFSSNLLESSETVLPQNVWLSYGRTYWSTSLSVQKNQTLHVEGVQYDKPYEREPQFKLRGYVADYKGFVLSSELEATHFVHPDKVNGTRTMINSAVSYPLQSAGWFFTPKAQYSMTWYNTDVGGKNSQDAQRYDKAATRMLPIYSVDAGLIFDRQTNFFGRSTEQTLEPRLFYAYIPYRNQSRLPNFDSSIADLNFAQLFTENIYTGYDRIGQANHLSAVMTTRLLDSESGQEWFNASVGQRYYFDDQQVGLAGNLTEKFNRRSDFLAATQAAFADGWKAEASAQYSTQLSRFVKTTAGVRWSPKTSSTVALYYRYNYAPNDPDNYIKQIDVSFQWPLTRDLYLLGRYNYSLLTKEAIESILGLEYRSGCWTFRTAVQQYTTASNKRTTSFFFQLELLGLGSVGISPIEALKDNINGYQPIGPRPTEVGRYDYYE